MTSVASANDASGDAPDGGHKVGHNNLEVELKFELTVADARALWRFPQFKAMLTGRPRTKTLRATYFDTPDFKLAERMVSLRVRKESRSYVQCLKANAADASVTGFARHEWEWRVPGPDLDASLMRGDPQIKTLLKGIKISDLCVLYSTDIKRQSRDLVTPGGTRIVCEFDQGRVMGGGAEAPLVELELELLSGDVGELLKLAQLVTSVVPARLSTRTKATRGFILAQGAGPVWEKARNPRMSKSASAEDVLRCSVLEGLKHLIANEDCVLARCHIEGVHQMRVALRRMRSVITTYKSVLPAGTFENLSQNLKDAGAVLGPARDWDVFLAEVLNTVEVGFENNPALALMRVRAQIKQDQAYRDADAFIHSEAYARLLTDALVWVGTTAWRGAQPNETSALFDASAKNIAKGILTKRHKRLLKAGKELKSLSTEQRHLLRIVIKKVRYAAEFFADLFPGKTTQIYLEGLKGLQNSLGHLNDLATAERLMAELAEGVQGQDALVLHRGAGLVEGWYLHAQSLREDNLLKAWKTFHSTKTFW